MKKRNIKIRIIYDRVWNRKNYFEIAACLNFRTGKLKSRKFNEKTNTSELF